MPNIVQDRHRIGLIGTGQADTESQDHFVPNKGVFSVLVHFRKFRTLNNISLYFVKHFQPARYRRTRLASGNLITLFIIIIGRTVEMRSYFFPPQYFHCCVLCYESTYCVVKEMH